MRLANSTNAKISSTKDNFSILRGQNSRLRFIDLYTRGTMANRLTQQE